MNLSSQILGYIHVFPLHIDPLIIRWRNARHRGSMLKTGYQLTEEARNELEKNLIAEKNASART